MRQKSTIFSIHSIREDSLSCTFRRYMHLELCSVSRKLSTIFGFQMMLQTITLQMFTLQLVIVLYDLAMMISTHSI